MDNPELLIRMSASPSHPVLLRISETVVLIIFVRESGLRNESAVSLDRSR